VQAPYTWKALPVLRQVKRSLRSGRFQADADHDAGQSDIMRDLLSCAGWEVRPIQRMRAEPCKESSPVEPTTLYLRPSGKAFVACALGLIAPGTPLPFLRPAWSPEDQRCIGSSRG
jgi:hypothetical protein